MCQHELLIEHKQQMQSVFVTSRCGGFSGRWECYYGIVDTFLWPSPPLLQIRLAQVNWHLALGSSIPPLLAHGFSYYVKHSGFIGLRSAFRDGTLSCALWFLLSLFGILNTFSQVGSHVISRAS